MLSNWWQRRFGQAPDKPRQRGCRARHPRRASFGTPEALEPRTLLAGDIYVATGGDDASGTGAIQAPYATLAHALAAAEPGDSVVLRGGTYAGGVRVDEPNITIRSYPGEWAVITAPTDRQEIESVIRFNPDASGGKLERLELIGGYFYALMFHSTWDWGPPNPRSGASRILVEDCRLHDSGRDVIKITPGSDDITILRSEIYNSGRRDPSNAEGIDNVNGDRMIVRDNYIHDIATNGIYAKGGAIGSLIERNLITNTGGGGVMVGFYTDEEFFDTTVNPDHYENIDAAVRNNIIVNTKLAGIGLYAALRPQIYNNTLADVARTGQAGILFAPGEIYFGSDPDPLIVPNRDATIVNNVIAVSAASSRPLVQIRQDALAGTLTLSHNRYFHAAGPDAGEFEDRRAGSGFAGNLTQWQAHISGDGGSTEGDPQLDGDYHLAPGSPLVDAGAPLGGPGDDYDGASRTGRRDIGADERDVGPALPVPPAPGTLGTGATSADGPGVRGGLRGRAFEDANGNGRFDASEPVLAGWTVFLDRNGNGGLDPDEPRKVTGHRGGYRLADLVPGPYTVSLAARPGFVTPGTVAHAPAGAVSRGIDVSAYRPARIRGTLFADSNHNGAREGNEPALSGWTVFLDSGGDGSLDPGEATQRTGPSGGYGFRRLRPGSYQVVQVVEAGWVQTLPLPPAGHSVTVSSGGRARADFGADLGNA